MIFMLTDLGWISSLIIIILVLAVLLIVLWAVGVIRYIPNDRIGVVEKLWSSSGSVKSGLLALHGEAGFQPDLRRGGFHFFPPLQYRVHIHPMVLICLPAKLWQITRR